jgi:hypothetical protein
VLDLTAEYLKKDPPCEGDALPLSYAPDPFDDLAFPKQ